MRAACGEAEAEPEDDDKAINGDLETGGLVVERKENDARNYGGQTASEGEKEDAGFVAELHGRPSRYSPKRWSLR